MPQSRRIQEICRRAAARLRLILYEQRGQTIPLLVVALTALLATGILLFQTGRAADLRAQAQTAADAAALAAGQSLQDQLTALDGSLNVDEASLEAAAADYAERNDADLTAFERDGYEVRVSVSTRDTLGGEEGGAAPDSDDEDSGLASAQAEVVPLTGFNGFGGFGGLGAPTEGLAPALKEAAALARQLGLTVTSTTGGVHAPGSFHYSGLAIDVAGTPALMRKYFLTALERYGEDQILELFYDAMPFYVDSGKRVSGTFGGHLDHVHIALPGNADPIGGEDKRGVEDESERGDDERGGDKEGGDKDGGDKDGGDKDGGDKDDGGDGDEGDDDGGGDDGDDDSVASSCDGEAPTSIGDDDDDERDKDRGGAERKPDQRKANAGPPSLDEVRDSESIPAIVYAVGKSMGASPKVMLAAFETAIVESGFRNLNYGDRDSLGVFQQRPSQDWGTPQQILDPFHAARSFFEKANKQSESQTAGQLAQAVQVSAFPDKYDQVEPQAEDLIEQVESGKRPVIKGGLGAIAPCGLAVQGGASVQLVEYEG